MIYLDNAATTVKKPDSVGKRVGEVISSGQYANPGRDSSIFSMNSSMLIQETRKRVANFFNVPSEDLVVFTKNVTEALNLVISGLFESGDSIISTKYEHNSVIRPLENIRHNGVNINYVDFNEDTGKLDLNQMESLITSDTKAIICTHESNVTGYVLPIEEIGMMCQKHNLLFIVDAAQTAGIEEIDIQKLNIDILCFTGHKSLFGPQGIGGLCFLHNVTIRTFESGGTGMDSFNVAMPDFLPVKFEAGTMNTPAIAGLNEGLKYLNEIGLDKIRSHVKKIMRIALDELRNIEDVHVYSNFQNTGSCLAFNIKNIDSASVSQMLWDEYNIATRAGAHCAPKVHEKYQTVDQGMVRVSFSWFNTEEEINTFLSAIKNILSEEVN